MQDDLLDAYCVCIHYKRLVERVAKKTFHTNNNMLKNWHWHCQLRAITNNYMWKRVTFLSASFYIFNLYVLLVLRLFLLQYRFFNRLEEHLNFLYTYWSPLVKFSQPPKTGDVIVSRVHTWWLDSYDILNGFGIK